MFSLRKLVFRPKIDDWAPLAKFFYADEALNSVASELDSLDARRDPDRCQQLVNQLRQCQDRVLQIIEEMLTEAFPLEADRAPRDFRVKFPDDILHENLPGQLWFGAECLAAGSNIVDREFESEVIRPLAKVVIQNIDALRDALRQQSLKNVYIYPQRVRSLLKQFDLVFAEFELNYVSAMVPVKSVREYEMQLEVAVLFSETLIRAMQRGYITQSMIDYCDPNVMITVPRLAIIYGLLLHPEGPLCVDKPTDQLPEMFRAFKTLLQKIRDLLQTLTDAELTTLERLLSSQDTPNQLTEDNTIKFIADYRKKPKKDRCPLASTQPIAGNSNNSNSSDLTKRLDGGANGDSESILMIDERRSSTDDHERTTNQPPRFLVDGNEDPTAQRTAAIPDDANNQSRRDSVDEPRMSTSSSTSSSLMSTSSEETEVSVRIMVLGSSEGDNTNNRSIMDDEDANTPDVEITYSGLNANSPSQEAASGSMGDEKSSRKSSSRSRSGTSALLRSRFRSPQDLIHRLFVCIAGVADQWQSNYPSDLRAVLKMVLHPEEVVDVYEVHGKPANGNGREEEMGIEVAAATPTGEAPSTVPWVPDSEAPTCSACRAQFTFVRRRHHCRNCGKIFCDRCSRNSAPLPKYGYAKPVRVCNQCFFYKLTPFNDAMLAAATTAVSSTRRASAETASTTTPTATMAGTD